MCNELQIYDSKKKVNLLEVKKWTYWTYETF
jgi:hypothetical protein